MSGILYVVATPIGNLEDMTHRAIAVLNTVDVIAAEDTRYSQRLLQTYNIKTPCISLHEHNERARSEELITQLNLGKNVALISDAGTPLVSDPGYHIVRFAHENGIKVSPIPGCCAAIAALCASGLNANSFIFEGFLPAKSTERQQYLSRFKDETRTLIFYETPHRILAALEDCLLIWGEERRIVLAREITKKFETIVVGFIPELLELLKKKSEQQKGEFVLLVEGVPHKKEQVCDESVLAVLKPLLSELPLNQAVKLAAKITGLKKNTLYQAALALQSS